MIKSERDALADSIADDLSHEDDATIQAVYLLVKAIVSRRRYVEAERDDVVRQRDAYLSDLDIMREQLNKERACHTCDEYRALVNARAEAKGLETGADALEPWPQQYGNAPEVLRELARQRRIKS